VDDVRRLAAEVRQRFSSIDVLVNDAGARFDRRQVSKDGVELTFAINALGQLLLTALLLDLLLAAPTARIVMVASEAY
jgi:NAD(P)-dependent dehydrogenase (short-subunit alcohol dehydrogenase family)